MDEDEISKDTNDIMVDDDMLAPKEISMIKTLKQTPEFYLSLLEGQHDELSVPKVRKCPKGGELMIYKLEDFRKISQTYHDMNESRLRSCFRADGYRWGKSSGCYTFENIQMKREYTGLWNNGSSTLNNKFTRWMYYHPAHPRVVVHYIGDSDEAARVLDRSYHGNSLSAHPNRYTMTSPAILDSAREEFASGAKPMKLYRNSVTSKTDTFRNNKQVQNIKADYTRQMEKRRDWVLNLFLLGDSLKYDGFDAPFLRNFQVPELWLPMMAHPLVDEMRRLTRETNEPLIMHYDTQFSIGDYYLSAFCFRHAIFKDNPVVPLMFIAHDRKYKDDHDRAASIMFGKCSSSIKQIIMVSDMEFDFENVDKRVKHLYCWRHVTKAVERKLTSMKAEGERELMRMFEKLKFKATEAEFDQLWNSYKQRPLLQNQPEVEEYMEKQIKRWKKHCSVWLLKSIGYPDAEKGCYNNASESLNALILEFMGGQVPPDTAAVSLHFLAIYYTNEITRGRRTVGEFTLKTEYQHLRQSPTTMPKLQFTPIPKEILEYCMRQIDTNTNPPLNRDTRSIDAMAKHSVHDENVVMMPGGRLIVKDGDKSFVVQMSLDSKGRAQLKCTCNFVCMHVLSARAYTNLNADNPNTSAGKFLRRKRIANREGPSGRKRPRPNDTDPTGTLPVGQEDDMDNVDNEPQYREDEDNIDNAIPNLDIEQPDIMGDFDMSLNIDMLYNNIQEQPTDHQPDEIIEDEYLEEENNEYEHGGNEEEALWMTMLLAATNKSTVNSLILYPKIVRPTFGRSLGEEEYSNFTVVIADPEGNVGAACLLDADTIQLISPAQSTQCLVYLASFMARSTNKAMRIKVKEIGVQKMDVDDQYSLLAAQLVTISNGEDPSLYDYHLEDPVEISRTKRKAKHTGSQTQSFERYCCCNKPWTNAFNADIIKSLEIPDMVQCSRKQCAKWYYVTCVDYRNTEKGTKFFCHECTIPFNVPVRNTSMASNTCSVDCILALISSHYSLHPEFVSYFDTTKQFSRLLRCGLQLISKGYGQQGKEYFMDAVLKARGLAEGTMPDVFGSEDHNYLNRMKNDGGFIRNHTSTCTNAHCTMPNKQSKSTTLQISSNVQGGGEWVQRMLEIVAPEEKQNKCMRKNVDGAQCEGMRTTTTTFDATPWFLPFEVTKQSVSQKMLFEIPEQLNIGDNPYRLSGCTISLTGKDHFVSIIKHQKNWLTYDDLAKPPLHRYAELQGEITYIYYFRHA